MPYLIDGHNLIGQLSDISLDDPNDEALLVQKLNGFAARTHKRCVVIFDHGLPGGKSRMSTRGVQVVFASQRSNADRVMIERISKIPDPKNWTAISSDNDVRAAAVERRMQVMLSADFAVLVEQPFLIKPDMGERENIQLSANEVEEWLKFFNKNDRE